MVRNILMSFYTWRSSVGRWFAKCFEYITIEHFSECLITKCVQWTIQYIPHWTAGLSRLSEFSLISSYKLFVSYLRFLICIVCAEVFVVYKTVRWHNISCVLIVLMQLGHSVSNQSVFCNFCTSLSQLSYLYLYVYYIYLINVC